MMAILRFAAFAALVALGCVGIAEAQFNPPAMLSGMPFPNSTPQTAWNPSDKVTVTLSTIAVTNDTATSVSNGNYQNVRSCFQSTSCSGTPSSGYTNKVFAQFDLTGALIANNTFVGFCNAAVSPFVGGSSSPCGATDNHGVIVTAGSFGNGPPVMQFNSGGTTLTLGGTATSTHFTIEVALDVSGSAASCSGTPCAWARYFILGAWTDWNNQAAEVPGGSHPFLLTAGPTGPFWAYGGETFNESGATMQLICTNFLHSSSVPSGYTAC